MIRQPPGSDAEWARNTENRLRRIESSPGTLRIGQWVLADRDGELIAVASDGRSYTLSSAVVSTTSADVTAATAAANAAVEAASATHFTRVVKITLTGWVVGGSFTLTFEGATTAGINHNASAGALLAALAALPNYSVTDFVVTGSDGGPWTVAIPGVSISGDNSGLDYVPLFGGDVVIK